MMHPPVRQRQRLWRRRTRGSAMRCSMNCMSGSGIGRSRVMSGSSNQFTASSAAEKSASSAWCWHEKEGTSRRSRGSECSRWRGEPGPRRAGRACVRAQRRGAVEEGGGVWGCRREEGGWGEKRGEGEDGRGGGGGGKRVEEERRRVEEGEWRGGGGRGREEEREAGGAERWGGRARERNLVMDLS